MLPLSNIKLSSNEYDIEAFSVITTGYCNFLSETSYDYNFGKNLVKAVYHNKSTIYLVVPISYMQDWLGKRLVSVNDNHYVLAYDLMVSAGIKSKSSEFNNDLIPFKGEITSVIDSQNNI